jgi:hypothetical protein
MSYARRSSGLYNSTQFIVQSLNARGAQASIVEVVDNNSIDREVTNFQPDVVVIEALWVVPDKFDILKQLHPKVKWFVHLHSNMPFLALEGIAMQWILDCSSRDVKFIANSIESYDALKPILEPSHLVYLPNVYISVPLAPKVVDDNNPTIDIGCFGALRPLKNQLLQALAAIQFAQEMGKSLRFHVNATRLETGGQPVLKNLIQLFERIENAELVQEAWYDPADFLNLLQQNIDLGMQVSLTETFNVVTADYVTAGLPVVVSDEVKWAGALSKANVHDIEDIVKAMHRNWNKQDLVALNQQMLQNYSSDAQTLWFSWLVQTTNTF